MLKFVLQIFQPATSYRLDEGQLIPNLFQRRVPQVLRILIGNNKLWAFLPVPERRDEFSNKFVWNQTNNDSHRDRNHSKNKSNCPLRSIQTSHRKGLPSHEDDQDLSTDYNTLNANEIPVFKYSLKNVETIVDTAAARIVLAKCLSICRIHPTYLY